MQTCCPIMERKLHSCMRRQSTCPMYRVNLRPTTQCKCQWEINTESVPTPISQPVVYVICEGCVYPLLATPDTIHFPFSFNTVEINWTSSHSQAHTIQHQTQCQFSTMYTHPCNAVLPHTNAMQFVPLHSNP